jgi:protease IV
MNAAKPLISTFFENFGKFIAEGQYAMNQDFALEQFKNFLMDVESLQAGMKAEEIGIKERKAAQLPKLITYKNGRGSIIHDPEAILKTDSTPAGSFAHLKLTGMMRVDGGWCTRGVGALVDDIQNAYGNPNIAGILLEVRSGGGESMAGQMLKSVLTDSPIPVVELAHFSGSAAEMATLPVTEKIASDQMAQFGSIGTYLTVDNSVFRFYKQWYTDIYADKSSNKNRSWRDALDGNLETLKQEVNIHNEYFLDAVMEFRDLRGSQKQIDETLSGKMFYAPDAKKRGLVDGIGNMNYALQRLASYAK